ncbi:MAG: CheD, stimulates methylation of MCP protein [uncultured bacterium]|nr:MAG: CheD, stimulates methylation of MCP protein [uncultured bacterium]HBH18363.1 chemotaxis protein CheD [Cyanobacteria bacterium UBA9579]
MNVRMGEIKVSKSPGAKLMAPGLGSCIGLTMYDPVVKAAGLAHVVLPDSSCNNKPNTLPGKYADIAVPNLLEQMRQLGAKKENIITKIAGGSQMFSFEKGSNILNIGMRNTIAVKAALSKEGLHISSSNTGGNKGRTLQIDVLTGNVYVKIIGQQEVEF